MSELPPEIEELIEEARELKIDENLVKYLTKLYERFHKLLSDTPEDIKLALYKLILGAGIMILYSDDPPKAIIGLIMYTESLITLLEKYKIINSP